MFSDRMVVWNTMIPALASGARILLYDGSPFGPAMSDITHLSDDVLNPSGVRYGSAEIYGVLEQLHGVISDALCVGQRRSQDAVERVLLFVKMLPGRYLDECIKARIRKAIRKHLSPRYLPAYMFQVKGIPVRHIFSCCKCLLMSSAIHYESKESRDCSEDNL